MVLGTAVGSERGKCQADKSARLPQTHTFTHTHSDISDLCSESATAANSYALNAGLPSSSPSLSLTLGARQAPSHFKLKKLPCLFAHLKLH